MRLETTIFGIVYAKNYEDQSVQGALSYIRNPSGHFWDTCMVLLTLWAPAFPLDTSVAVVLLNV